MTLRSVKLDLDSGSGVLRVTGEVWNPGPEPLNMLSLRGDLYDTKGSKIVWTKDQRVIDEFVTPLAARDSKSFEFVAAVPVRADGSNEFRMYMDGALYKSYTIGKSEGAGSASTPAATTTSDTKIDSGTGPSSVFTRKRTRVIETLPAPAPNTTPSTTAPAPAPLPGTAPDIVEPAPGGPSPEQKTLDDLDR